MVGRSGNNAMSIVELKEKFDDCASGALTNAQREAAFQQLMTLESLADIGALMINLKIESA